MIPLTSSEIQHIASASADAAVRKLLLTMGVDTSDDKAVLEMQKDFADLRGWRTAKETIKRQTLISAVVVIVTGLAGFVYVWFHGGGAH